MTNHLKPIEPLTIEAILAWEFVGNAHSDSAAFTSISEFAENPANSVEDRVKALRHMAHAGMGLTGQMAGDHLNDLEYLGEFLASLI